MPLLTWSNDYSVGVKSLDSQHTNLFNILNELYDAMKAGKGQEVSGALLRKLVSYTKEHFAAEEGMMERVKYPSLAKHRERHAALIQQVGDFMARFEKGEGGLTVELLGFLRDWLKNHIQREDKEYGPWLNQHGQK